MRFVLPHMPTWFVAQTVMWMECCGQSLIGVWQRWTSWKAIHPTIGVLIGESGIKVAQ
jgi:hypothetical protein